MPTQKSARGKHTCTCNQKKFHENQGQHRSSYITPVQTPTLGLFGSHMVPGCIRRTATTPGSCKHSSTISRNSNLFCSALLLRLPSILASNTQRRHVVFGTRNLAKYAKWISNLTFCIYVSSICRILQVSGTKCCIYMYVIVCVYVNVYDTFCIVLLCNAMYMSRASCA